MRIEIRSDNNQDWRVVLYAEQNGGIRLNAGPPDGGTNSVRLTREQARLVGKALQNLADYEGD